MSPSIVSAIAAAVCLAPAAGDEPAPRRRSDPQVMQSSWDDLLQGVRTREEWERRRKVLRESYIEGN